LISVSLRISGLFNVALIQMARIVKLGNPILRMKALPRAANSVNVELIKAMEFVLRPEHNKDSTNFGIAVSAPQLGVLERSFAMFAKPSALINGDLDLANADIEYCINPEVVDQSDDTEVNWEMCLSIPGYMGLVKRPKEIHVRYFNQHGELKGKFLKRMTARVFLHETDHLDGILFIDQSRLAHTASLMHIEEWEQNPVFDDLDPEQVLQIIESGEWDKLQRPLIEPAPAEHV
jgi:peptide deformylase